jgi:hypothetical protein
VTALALQACQPTTTEAPASPPASAVTLSPEQQRYQQSAERMRSKFGRVGIELVVDAMKGEEFLGVDFYPEHSEQGFFGHGMVALNSNSKQLLSNVPERARIVWREAGYKMLQNEQGNYVPVGKILGDEVIEVGSRIPQAVIDDLRRDHKGILRLKFRMHRQGTLFGWDIERRPGYDPKQRDANGQAVYVPPMYSLEGGDFKGAHPAHHVPEIPEDMRSGRVALSQEWLDKGYYLTGPRQDKLWEKGWYIDKKTGQKIEIDF